MKQFIIPLLCILIWKPVRAQDRFEIQGSYTTNLKPSYNMNTVGNYDTVHVHLRLRGKFDSDPAKNSVVFQLDTFNLRNSAVLANTSYQFRKEEWPGSMKVPVEFRDTILILAILSNGMKDTLKGDEFGHIIIQNHPEHFHTIRFTNSLIKNDYKYDKNKPFWIEVGSNFDLIDGLQPNNFFSGVFFHRRDIRPLFKKIGNKINKEYVKDISRVRPDNLAIFAGIYEAKSITSTQEQNYSLRNYYDSTSFLQNARDSIKIYKGVGTYTNQRVVRNVSLFFSPQLRLTNGSSNEDGFHAFASLWFELQWQKISEDKSFSQIRKRDSFNIHFDSIQNYSPQSFKHETDIRSHYVGIGFPIFYRETFDGSPIQLLVNPVFGVSNQPGTDTLEFTKSNSGNLNGRKWNAFYFVQFRLNEEKYGISFTGEVRGLLRKNNSPTVTIALSKKFDLTKFVEFNK